MKAMFKIRVIFITLFILPIIISVQNADSDDMKKNVRNIQSNLRKSMNGLKYDGSKVTYFESKNKVQFKEVEVILFLREKNMLFFNGELATGRINLKIYDKAVNDPDRLVLFEVKNINSKTVSVTEEELNERLSFYEPNPTRLRSVFIDYEISKSKKEERGAIVMAIGYEDKNN